MIFNPSTFIGEPVVGSNSGSFLYSDANSKLAQDNARAFWDTLYNRAHFSAVDIIANGSTTNYYVSTIGSDSNDGLTALTPFLTIEKARNTIPMFIPGIYQINVADGTYTLSAELEFTAIYGKSGITGNSATVIKFVGNTTTPANVLIKGATATTNCFTVRGAQIYFDIDGVNFDTCGTGLTYDGSRGIIRGVNVTNFRVAGWTMNNFANVTTDTTAIGGILTSVAGLSTVGFQALGGSQFTCSKNTITITGIGGTGIGVLVATLTTRLLLSTTTFNFTGSTTAGAGISVSNYGFIQVRNTLNITGTTGLNQAGIIVRGYGLFSVVLGATFNFTNHQYAWRVESFGQVTAVSGTPTINYVSGVSTCVKIQDNGVIDSNNFLNAGNSIEYISAVGTSPIYGNDHRYVQMFRPQGAFVDCVDADRTLTTSSGKARYTSITVPHNVYLPTIAIATGGIDTKFEAFFDVTDSSGNCSATNTITVQCTDGVTLINGKLTYILNSPYASARFAVNSTATGYTVVSVSNNNFVSNNNLAPQFLLMGA